MFGIKFNRLVAATAVLALCCGASFAAGPKKMGMHKMTKVSVKKTNLVHKGKAAKLEQPEQNLSEEELFARFVEAAGANNAFSDNWAEEWKRIETIALDVQPAWADTALQNELRYAASIQSAVRHSETFRQTYNPHYRIIENK